MENVVRRCRAGDLVERTQGVVEVDEHHLVRSLEQHGSCCSIERGDGVLHQLLVADVSKKAPLRLSCAIPASQAQNLGAQLLDALAGESRSHHYRKATVRQ